jgi:Ca2+-dependent lipid-binding protein
MATAIPSNGSTNGQAKVNAILENDAAKGRVAVHSFDPNSSPAEKGAAAGKGRDQLKSIIPESKVSTKKELPVDTGRSNTIPTITVNDVDAPKLDAKGDAVEEVARPTLPGGMPAGHPPALPDWYRVGWRAASKIDDPPLEGEEKEKAILDAFLSEQYYGSWYHNAGIIFFAVFASHFLTRFSFGWGWLIIVLAICSTYYITSMTRVRRHARDDIQRELVKTRLASESESADWINNFLDRFWLIYEPTLSQTIIATADQILSASTPAFLDSIRLTHFTLGTKAPRIDKVRTFPDTDEDIVMMDWEISFTPNDISDLTQRQAAKKVNPKIILSIRLGKGLATASMPILLEDITFSGKMRIRMKLMTPFPHVQIVDVSFMEKPVIDYVLKPLGGDTFGFDVANIPGLSSFIRDMTHATLGPMMYDPNVFTLNLEQLLSGAPLDTAIGVLQLTVQSARGIKGMKLGGGTPDPFVSISISGREELAHTKHKPNTYNPTWMETKFIIINNLSEIMTLDVYDYNDHRKNTLLGTASFELSKLQVDATQENIEATILKDGKDRGELRFDVSFYPVLKPEVGEDKDRLPESSVGIVRITIHQAKDLDHTKSLSGDLNPFAKIVVGGEAIHKTKIVKHNNNPIWESPKEFLCADRTSSVVTIKIIDDRDFLKDPVVGYVSVKLEDLLSARIEAGRDWWPLSGCKSGKVRISTEWKPLNMAGSLHGANQYSPPIGVVRLWLDRATDVKNVEAALGGKSDPYMRVQINNVTKGRTEVVNNNLNPVWDQIIYIPVHSLKELLLLECMDYQHLTKDRSLGSFELRVSDLAKEHDDVRFPFTSTGIKTATDPLRLDKKGGFKGQVHYTAQFIPAVALRGANFASAGNEVQRLAGADAEDDDGDVVDDASSNDDDEKVPEGVTVKGPVGAVHAVPPPPKAAPAPESKTEAPENGNGHEKEKEEIAAPPPPVGVDMTREELLSQQSGVIIFNVKGGELAKKARLDVLMDEGYWPAFHTSKARSTHANWEHVGEGFVKELDFGRVWLRLNEAPDGEKDDIIGEWKGDAKAFLQATLDGPKKFTLTDPDDRHTSTVEIEARFVPVPVVLEARESVNNQGTLYVDLLDGREIHGVDRGGKSDPYAVFSLDGQKVFKSQTKKKTLSPDWNEKFTVQVHSRVGASFSVEIFDWNQIEQAKSLGTSKIELADLEPFQAIERSLPLVSEKHGEKGEVRVRLMFQPEIIAKSRKNTSTFSAAGRAMTNLGGLPVGAGKGVLSVFKREKDFAKGKDNDHDSPPPEIASGQHSQPAGLSDSMVSTGKASAEDSSNGSSASITPGTLKVTVLQAKDLSSSDIKPYVTIRIGDKEHKTKHAGKTATPEWNETLLFSVSQLTPKLFAWVHDHKTLGKDKQLGEGEIDIWRHITPGTTPSADLFVELREGQGLLRLRLEYSQESLGHGPSLSSIDRPGHVSSPSRFSLRTRRSQEVLRD